MCILPCPNHCYTVGCSLFQICRFCRTNLMLFSEGSCPNFDRFLTPLPSGEGRGTWLARTVTPNQIRSQKLSGWIYVQTSSKGANQQIHAPFVVWIYFFFCWKWSFNQLGASPGHALHISANENGWKTLCLKIKGIINSAARSWSIRWRL